MSLRDKLKLSLFARFSLATALSVACFVVIALILLFSFIQVRGSIGQVVEVQLQQTVESARFSRDLANFLARLNLLQHAFYGDDQFLQQEGDALLLLLNDHQHTANAAPLIGFHESLEAELTAYLAQCRRVNELLLWLNWEEQSLDEGFDVLEEIVREKQAEPAPASRQAYYRQLGQSLSDYRVSFYEIIQQGARVKPQVMFSAAFFDPPPNSAGITSLKQTLAELLNADRPVSSFGRHLVDQLDYYLHLLTRFQQEMIHLGKQTRTLETLSKGAMARLEAVDRQQTVMAETVVREIDKTIISSGLTVFTLLLVLALSLGIIQLNLFRHHIQQPMMKVRGRLLRFQQGDHQTPMNLERQDEWHQVETVFNDMLTDMVESWNAVQESERRYRNIFDSASIGIFQSTVEGAFLHINPALVRMLGIQDDADLAGYENLAETIYANPADRQKLIERMRAEDAVDNYQVEMKRQSGEKFWASISGHMVRDHNGQLLFMEGTVDDISQRRSAEIALLRLKEYLHDIVNTMPSILVGIDNNLKVTLWNKKAAAATGTAEDVALGRALPEVFKLLELDDYQKAVNTTLRLREVIRLQKVAGRVNQETRYFDLLVYPLSGPEVSGAVIYMDDVTEKVQIEEVMVQSEKMLSVGNLAAGMAHEINNPLASILQNAQVLKQRLSPELEKNRQIATELGIRVDQIADYAQRRGFEQMIKSIADAGQRAARIIENVLNFSRKSTSSFVPCDLVDLVEKTIELAASDYDMKHHFDFRKIHVSREFQPVPDVPCESSQIQQVVLSLLKNAAQAIGKDVEKPTITVRLFERDQQVCLQIEDNGAGIDEVTSRRIFEPFYTTKDVGTGTGLGLSVAYFLIAENHKGRLTVSSQPGQGSCFSVWLPLKRSNSARND